MVQRLDERIGRGEALSLELPINPLEEGLDQRLAVSQSMQLLGLAGELERADVLLDGEQGLELLQCLGRSGGLIPPGDEQPAPAVAPAPSRGNPRLSASLLEG